MSTKLAQITTQYRRFTKNQVLTEAHLNEVLDYFDDQDRLSRICLTGVGIVCGFKVTCTPEGELVITQGTGVTTDGDLFHLFEIDEETSSKIIDIEKLTYTHYKVYDNEKSEYKPFFYQGNNQIDLYEALLEEGDEDTHPLTDLESNEGLALKDAVVLLYLETYEKDQDLCVSLTCDNQGLEIVGNYKVLITTKANAAHIKSFDSTLSETDYQYLFYQLPEILANRAITLKEDFHHYPGLKDKFASETLKNNLITRVRNGYNTLLNGLGLTEIRDIINLKLDDLFAFSPGDVPPDFQYRYDLLKDIIDTYHEIRDLLGIAEASRCCADLNAFPKHLMLGEVGRTDACYEFRHGFYRSPAITGSPSICGDCDPEETTSTSDHTVPELVIDFSQANLDVCYSENTDTQHLRSLIKRVVLLLTNYNANYAFIKVTPSMHLGALSKKAIPFYYNVGNQTIASWDYAKTIKGRQDMNNSYHEGHLRIKQPLKFCIDHDFYRIEGHQGMNYQDVLGILAEVKRVNQLAFNVVALPINATEAQPIVENYTSYYLSRNIGIEHKAGVVPGGTFVIIYIEGEYDAYPYPYGYGYPYGYPSGGGAPFGGDFEDIGEDGEPQVVLNPVVADFMLPYLCCDENVVELRLPVSSLCFTSDTEPLEFEVNPNGGFVSAVIDPGLNGGVVRNDAGQFVFDPNLVSEELYGEEIQFRVNNLDTECVITINPLPVYSVAAASINYDRPNNRAEVIFEITPESISTDQTFSWNFGDVSNVVESQDLTIAHTYDLSALDGDTVEVITNAANGDCTTEVLTQVVFELIPEIRLSDNEFCRNDETPHSFEISPPQATPEIAGPGVVEQAGQFFFVPANVPQGVSVVTFTVNGQPSGFTVSMNDAPQAAFTDRVEDNTLILSNGSNNVDRYTWVVDGEVIERDRRSEVRRSIDNFPTNTIQVSLTAHSDDCGIDTDGPREVIVRQELTCEEQAQVFIDASIVRLDTLENNTQFGTILPVTAEAFQLLRERYQTVQSELQSFLDGSMNDRLPDMFNTDLLGMIENGFVESQSDFETDLLRQMTELTVKLAYRIMGCQQPDMIVEFRDQITQALANLTSLLARVSQRGINVDPDGVLLAFLQEALQQFEDHGFIVQQINRQIAAIS